MNENPGGTCVYVPYDIETTDQWQTIKCGERDKGHICELEAGRTCPDGWTYFRSGPDTDTCVLFVVNGKEHTTWWSAHQYCASYGAQLFLPRSKLENDALNRYTDDWKRAGVTRLWLGAADNSGTCDFKTEKGYPLDYFEWGADEPMCQEDSDINCVYLNTIETENNWAAGNCYAKEAFACQVDVGQERFHQTKWTVYETASSFQVKVDGLVQN